MDQIICQLISLVILTLLIIECKCRVFNFCYTNNYNQVTRFYGTKTTYTTAKQWSTNKTFNHPFNCKPVMLYLINRHAIRYPDQEDIAEMPIVLPRIQQQVFKAASAGRSRLCWKDVERIVNWRMKWTEADDKRISDSGKEETRQIANRFRSKFPQLMNPKMTKFIVGSTNTDRALQTAEAFLHEVSNNSESDCKQCFKSCFNDSKLVEKHFVLRKFSETAEETAEKVPVQIQKFLHFHETCFKQFARQGVEFHRPKPVVEFLNSQRMRSVLTNVSNRLGLNRTLNTNEFRHVVRLCRYDFALFGAQNSPWCAALGQDDIRTLEYFDDLEDYYNDGYGRDINIKSTCPLFSDIVKNIKLLTNNPQINRQTHLYFTHSPVLKRLYAAFGLFNDLHSGERQWRTSLIAPFSANVALVLYRCNQIDNDKQEFKLLTLVNESPVTIKGCESKFCSVNSFLRAYESMAEDCDLTKICRI